MTRTPSGGATNGHGRVVEGTRADWCLNLNGGELGSISERLAIRPQVNYLDDLFHSDFEMHFSSKVTP